jgi:threonine dehydrogenase-like Zn-dependent dehydrogenase
MDCLKTGKIDPKKYITHRTNFSEMITDFGQLIDPKNNVIKALIEIE